MRRRVRRHPSVKMSRNYVILNTLERECPEAVHHQIVYDPFIGRNSELNLWEP